MKRRKDIYMKIMYAALFLIVLPVLLFVWAVLTEDIITLPAVKSLPGGAILSSIGVVMILWGWYALKTTGKGLPMNAFPPPVLVTTGPYKLVKHPIYWGFGILVVGLSILTGSASGLWLVTPVATLGMVALVLGYERIDLQKRFGSSYYPTTFGLPQDTDATATTSMRVRSGGLIVGAVVLSNGIILEGSGESSPLFGGSWAFDALIPVRYVVMASFLVFMATPLFLGSQSVLRQWRISSLIALALVTFTSLTWPEIGAQYLPIVNREENWSLFTIHSGLLLISASSLFSRQPGPSPALIALLALLSVYQVVINTSSILYLITAVSIAAVAIWYKRIWLALRNLSELIANSWREWTFGPVRVINHGIYVGASAFLTILFCGWLAGSQYAWALLAFAITVIVFSAIWAQLIEGSEKLKRPYGYYGALVGVAFAGLVVWVLGYDVWIIIGVVSVAMPWAQGIGRLRCLINGCCHGSVTSDSMIGIRYFHYRSRVCGISGLKGELLHPTPLYSILWLFFVGFVLLALWLHGMTPSFIFGMYLILTGLGRFVEEAYRGEVQTVILGGLRLYQWTAIASVFAGIVFTAIPTDPIVLTPGFEPQLIYASILGGLFTFFAMGVDFPRSNARFSRLV